METFPATYFTFTTRYPESGSRVQLGRSYQWDSMPEAPDQRIFVLTLGGMTYFTEVDGVTLDLTKEPGRNMAVLEAFYNTHKRALKFILNHPVYGPVTCKFNRPLEIPSGMAGAQGLIEKVEVELIETP